MNIGKKTLLASSCSLLAIVGTTEAALDVGMVQVIGFRADDTNSEGLSFVTWTDLSAGTSLLISDRGASTAGVFGTFTNDNTITWTNTTGAVIEAGQVITILEPAIGSTSVNFGSVTGQFDDVSASGDQFFIFEGSESSPSFVHGIDFNGTVGWEGLGDNTTSALPDVLNVTNGNFSFAEFDNGQYTGSRTGMTVEEFQAALADSSNWSFSNSSADITLNATAFSIVPEPSTYAALLGLVALGLAVRRRSKR